jgi:molybdopterin/thiamine biosynthesis adenylyltransferase
MEDKVESALLAAPLPCLTTEEVFLYPKTDRSPSTGSASRILVVGAGALGCAALRTLAQDRSVRLTLADDDRVELSNLQRQVLYDDGDIGRLKVEAAAARLASDFGADVRTVAGRFDSETGPGLVAASDLVVDATDDPATKFLIGRLSVQAGVPYVYGGVARTGGQWMLVDPGNSACLECVFPPSTSGAVETAAGCSALGILAPVAGVVGAMQALSALAFLRRPERAAAGRLYVYELTGVRTRHVDFMPSASCFCQQDRQGVQRKRQRS